MHASGLPLMELKFTISNRKVEALEKVSVKAGVFDAYKITYNFQMKSIFTREIKVNQWMAPGIGLEKSENLNARGTVKGGMELVSYKA